eukprot:871340_1
MSLIAFDSCNSRFVSMLNMLNNSGDIVIHGDEDSYCGERNQQLRIDPGTLDVGEYILEIESYRCGACGCWYPCGNEYCSPRCSNAYEVHMTCTPNLILFV